MKFSFARFKKLKPLGAKNLLTDESVIFAGVLFLAVVFAALIAVDAYLFYTVRARGYAVASQPPPPPALSAEDIDEVMRMIDQREQEYRAMLNAP